MVTGGNSKLVEKAWTAIDNEKMVSLLVNLINTPSPTGRERPVALVLGDYMKAEGLEVDIQEVEDQRANAVGTLRGKGGGPRMMLNGHLDTSFTGVADEDLPMAGEIGPALAPKAFRQNGSIYGLGAQNMKGGVATITEAVCAVRRAGIELKGDAIVAGVAGEIEKSPVDSLFKDYRGSYYRGSGAGISYLVNHGYITDFSITAEPNGTIEYARPGFLFVKITVRGKVAYGPSKWEGDNAVLRMSKLVQALEENFAPMYTQKHSFDLGGDWGTIKPTVNVGAIESGWPYKPGFVPGICCSYLDMRVVPGQSPIDALGELNQFLSQVAKAENMSIEAKPFVTRPASKTDPGSVYVTECVEAYKHTAKKTPPGFSCAFGDDSNVTRAFGIPSVTWGPPAYGSTGVSSETDTSKSNAPGEFIRIEDMIITCKMYVESIINICMRERNVSLPRS